MRFIEQEIRDMLRERPEVRVRIVLNQSKPGTTNLDFMVVIPGSHDEA